MKSTKMNNSIIVSGAPRKDLAPNKTSTLVLRAVLTIAAALWPILAPAQTTSFTYQGRFTDGGTAANGAYDMQFRLFDSATVGAGNQIGSTINNGAVSVKEGVFTVQLDYGAAAFAGADRYLEIGVRPAGSADAFTLLSPRQQLTSAVYAIRAGVATTADTAKIADSANTATTATNATQLGGVAANQYVQTSDARLSDARTPTAGSSNYIQNGNNQQTGNFNITGNGTAGGTLSANVVDTATTYSIGGKTVFQLGGVAGFKNSNTFAGVDAGTNTTPLANVNFEGNVNSFFGFAAGNANTTGRANSFFGAYSGTMSITGWDNSFFGNGAGYHTTTGSDNTFIGSSAGLKNTAGESNAFLGYYTGYNNTIGKRNVFVGNFSGFGNDSGSTLTLLGHFANVGQPSLTNATALGALSQVSQSNSLVLGSIKGINDATADTNVGIGTTAPNARLHIATNGGNIVMGNAGCASTFVGLGFGASLSGCANYSLLGNGTDTIISRPTGGTLFFREGNSTQMSIAPNGVVALSSLGSGGSFALCANNSIQITLCGSSLRYKTNIQPFISGLSVLNRLRPITFDWKDGGMHDLGFAAEEVAAVEPLLVTHNNKGQIEGVKYDRISAVLVNSVKEQQAQIAQQQEQIKRQQVQIESLRQLVCARNRRAAVCK